MSTAFALFITTIAKTTGGGNGYDPVSIGGSHNCKPDGFFGLVPWYQYLDYGWQKDIQACGIRHFKLLGSNSDIPLILLAVVDDLLRIAGIVAIIFVIVGGVKYMVSMGSPDAMSNARTTIINALIGLAIAILGVAIVTFLGKALT